jgi:hypothetical protein
LRHVEIIDEDYNLIASFLRPVLPLSSSGAHLAIDESLHLVGIGLSGKSSGKECVVGIIVVLNELV